MYLAVEMAIKARGKKRGDPPAGRLNFYPRMPNWKARGMPGANEPEPSP